MNALTVRLNTGLSSNLGCHCARLLAKKR